MSLIWPHGRRQPSSSRDRTRAARGRRGLGARGGRDKLELHVFPHNEPAIALYEGFGFVKEGYRRGHYRRGGELIDAILMAYGVPPTLPR